MKLIRELIQKKFELYNELMMNRQYKRALWQFYSCFNLSMSLIGIPMDNKEVKKRNFLITKIILMKNIDDKKFKRVNELINKDMDKIISALNFIQEETITSYSMGDIYREGMVGILAFELENL